jgi:uracil phosphoribosyltransferase
VNMIHDLSKKPGMLGVYLSELRDHEVQTDRMRFRRNLERVGETMAHAIAETLPFAAREVVTPLGDATGVQLAEQPVLATILRAGLPMHQGFLNVFDAADNAFVSAYRKYDDSGDFEIEVEYMSTPDLEGRTVILIDPMLATGASIILVLRALLRFGVPGRIVVVCAIGSSEGIEAVRKEAPRGVEIWAAAIDQETTAKGYIVPGLGDAGDLAYGPKR